MRKAFGVVIIFGLFIAPRAASAVPIVDGAGILTGSTAVIVGGTSYDVQFVDGSCAIRFSGCDGVADFDFTTQADAAAAAQALLVQVFGDFSSFDLDPFRTAGCSEPAFCGILIPYATDGVSFSAAEAINYALLQVDLVGGRTSGINSDFGQAGFATFADFTPSAVVPEPASLILLGSGLAGVAARARRRRKRPTV